MVRPSPGRFEPGIPKELFKTALGANARSDQYAVTGDGQRFLIANPLVEGARYPLTVVLNWTAAMNR